MNDDILLVEKVKEGDLHSFDILMEKYQKQVYNVAYRFLGNHDDARDLAQEAFLRAFKSINSFRNDAKFKTWLYHITANLCKDELRKRKRTRIYSLDDPYIGEDGQEMEKQLKSDTPSPEEQVEIKENQKLIQSIIDSLPEDYRIILILREIQGLTYEEIAEILDCSMGTVKSRLNRARKQFKNKIIAYREQKLKVKRQVR